jgi:hypothetical protein
MPSGPKDKDVVLHCGHPDCKGQHFFQVNNIPFHPPATVNQVVVAQWIMQCDDCFAMLPSKPSLEDFVIRGSGDWIGDDPIIDHPVHEQN